MTLEELSKTFNIIGLAQKFYSDHKANVGLGFTGNFTVVFYKRSRTGWVMNKIAFKDMLLVGWAPNQQNVKTEYDFILTPLLKTEYFNNLFMFEPDIDVITVSLTLNKSGLIEVGISDYETDEKAKNIQN